MKFRVLFFMLIASLLLCSCADEIEVVNPDTPHAEAGGTAVRIPPTAVMGFELFNREFHQTWEDQEVTVTGVYMNITLGKDTIGQNIGHLMLYGNAEFEQRFVACGFVGDELLTAKQLIQGDVVTITGVVGGKYNSEPRLINCTFVE